MEIELGSSVRNVDLRIKILEHFRGDLPKYETQFASGMDIRAVLNESITLNPLQRTIVPTGLALEIPPGFEIQVRPRSGLAAKQGLTVLNSPGTVDADYRGELKVIIINLGDQPVVVNDQDRIAQIVLCPIVKACVEIVTDLSDTGRGVGGFGSTGRA